MSHQKIEAPTYLFSTVSQLAQQVLRTLYVCNSNTENRANNQEELVNSEVEDISDTNVFKPGAELNESHENCPV